MPENGFCDELPADVLEMHERTARSLANLWSDGCDAARQAIFAALCRETLRVSRSMPAPATLPFIKPENRDG